MEQLKEFYRLAGSNYDETVRRFNGNPDMVKRFVLKFLCDESFSKLKAFLEKGDAEEAFRNAHTLKGICANLGFTRLYARASEVTELLRSGKADEAKANFPRLEEEYEYLVGLLKGGSVI